MLVNANSVLWDACNLTRTTRFHHLPTFAFLHILLQGSIRHSSSTRSVELQSGPFYDIFEGLLSEKDAILEVVRGLLRPSHKNRLDSRNFIEDAD
jgi:hypothetical protein